MNFSPTNVYFSVTGGWVSKIGLKKLLKTGKKMAAGWGGQNWSEKTAENGKKIVRGCGVVPKWGRKEKSS